MKTTGILLLLMLTLWGLPSIAPANDPQTMGEPMPRGTLMVAQAAQAPSVRNLTVYVGVTGFNSTGIAGMRIDVNEGDMVILRFVYNDTSFGANNPHEICIQGYNLCTGTLDENIPERVLSFTANIVGQSTIECVVGGCAGHAKLQAGVLDVSPYGGGTQVKTNLTLTGEVVAHSRPIVVLVAQIYDENGSPVPGVLVHFFRNSTWGFAEIGLDASDGAGRANITYSPPLDGHITFMAHFLGSGIYMPSSSGAFIHYLVPRENDYDFPFVWGQNPIFDFSTVGVPAVAGLLWVGVVVLIVGSVWTTYLYVVRQLLGIRNSGRGEESSDISRLSTTSLGGYRDRQAQPLRRFDYPRAVITGLGMIALGYADFLALTILVPSSSLLALPLLAFIEAILLAKLLPSEE